MSQKLVYAKGSCIMDLYSELTAKYQTVPVIATEIISLEAVLNRPKPTEVLRMDILGNIMRFSMFCAMAAVM